MAEIGQEERMSIIAAPRLLSAKEVARILGVSPKRVRKLVADGDLMSVRLGGEGQHRFRPQDVERLINGEERTP
jgi:excisionase family DNA binding protein